MRQNDLDLLSCIVYEEGNGLTHSDKVKYQIAVHEALETCHRFWFSENHLREKFRTATRKAAYNCMEHVDNMRAFYVRLRNALREKLEELGDDAQNQGFDKLVLDAAQIAYASVFDEVADRVTDKMNQVGSDLVGK